MSQPQHAAPGQIFYSHAEFYKGSAYAAFDQEHRKGGSFGASMIEARQDALDFVDPAIPEIIIQYFTIPAVEIVLDLGDGPIEHTDLSREMINISPTNTEIRYIISSDHTARFFALPIDQLTRILEPYNLNDSCFGEYYGRMVPNAQAISILKSLWMQSKLSSNADVLFFDALVLQLLAYLSGFNGLAVDGLARPEDKRIARVIDYIEAHLGEALTIGELAAVACLSTGHFSRTFKATTGEPVWTYVQRRRCERARERLLHTRDAIAQIAYECGFSSQSHLTTSFQKAFGVTPAAIRTI